MGFRCVEVVFSVITSPGQQCLLSDMGAVWWFTLKETRLDNSIFAAISYIKPAGLAFDVDSITIVLRLAARVGFAHGPMCGSSSLMVSMGCKRGLVVRIHFAPHAADFSLIHLPRVLTDMVPKPSEEDEVTVMNEIERIASPLVYAPSLYRDLQEYHDMDWDLIQQTMISLEVDDEIGWKEIDADNEDNIRASQYVYVPADDSQTDFFA